MAIDMQAIVLCAGKGERMGAEFVDFQKCAIEVNGEPLIVRSVKSLVAAGIKDIFLLTGHKAEQVEACFVKSPYRRYIKSIFCGDPYQVPLNTLSTIAKAEQYIYGPFLCVHGDISLSPKVIIQLSQSFEANRSDMIIAVSDRREIAPTHARVEYDKNLIVKDIKRADFSNYDVWVGMDLCHPYVIGEYCINSQLTCQRDLAKAILSSGEEIRVVQYQQDWIHVTVPADLLVHDTVFASIAA